MGCPYTALPGVSKFDTFFPPAIFDGYIDTPGRKAKLFML